jgi:hypothetical protein
MRRSAWCHPLHGSSSSRPRRHPLQHVLVWRSSWCRTLRRVVPYSVSSYGAPPGATTAVPYASYATPYAAPLHAGCAARNASPTYVSYVAPNVALPHVGHTAFYVAPPVSAQIWAPSSPTEWVFDSGTTAHLSKDASILHSLSSHPVYRHVTIGDGSSVPVSSSGHASIPFFI